MHAIKDSENQSMDVYFVVKIIDHRSDEQYLFESSPSDCCLYGSSHGQE